jgi:hypothetical protein
VTRQYQGLSQKDPGYEDVSLSETTIKSTYISGLPMCLWLNVPDDCTDQGESVTAQWLNQMYFTILLCLMPDDFAQGRVLALDGLRPLSATSVEYLT